MKSELSINTFWIFWFVGFLLPYSCSSEEVDHPTVYPKVRGTFIQEYLVRNWDDVRWDQEFKDLKEVGMEYLIFAPAFNTDAAGKNQSIYPSSMTDNSSDLVEICLRNAKKNQFKVFLGLNFNERWWQVDYSPEWLYEQMEIGNKVADELVERYKSRYEETLYGWYWVWEVDNLNCNTSFCRDALANALNINRDYLATITPSMPFMLSPFVNYRIGSADENEQLWKEVFSKVHFKEGDIFAPQDGVGAGGLTVEMLPEWFEKMAETVKSKPGLRFWANVENFDHRFWTSATLDRYTQQMTAVQPYVSNLITFAYSHYYSPLYVNEKFHNAYLYYYQHGVLPKVASPAPVLNPVVENTNNGQTVVRWQEPQEKTTVVGYRIYKNGELTGELQCRNEGCSTTFVEPTTAGGIYEVASYNVIGNESSKTTAVIQK